jgi:predicted transposase/invertase (TIGR01784 family)
LSEEKYILDAKSKRIQAWRKGLAEGMSQGIEKGKSEGKAEGLTEVARNMKSMGFSDEQIRQATGLSPEEIEKAAIG